MKDKEKLGKNPIRTLVVEDSPDDFHSIQEMLTETKAENIKLSWVDCLSKGLEYPSMDDMDIVLLDLSLPDSQGLETFTKLHERIPSVPIVVLSGVASRMIAIMAVKEGAQDYLVKGQINGELLVRSIHYSIERKKTEKKLEEANEMVRKANECLEERVKERTAEVEKLLHQKDEFVNQLSHDLKTPLGPIINLLPLVMKRGDDPESKEMLEVISRNAGFMKSLVMKAVELAQLNAPKTEMSMEDTNLLNEVNSIIEKNKLFFKDNNTEVRNNLDNDTIVRADKLRLEQLFNHLFTNAIKYSKDGGSTVTIDVKNDGDFVTVSVKDTGIGMTGEQLDHIFEEFYKADDARHDFDSNGLGLSICKCIVKKHGGKIWAESPGEGKGTTMFFTIPSSSVKSIKNEQILPNGRNDGGS